METIETERLILRTPKMTDVHALYYYASKPNIGPHAGWYPHSSIYESEGYLRAIIKENSVWSVTIKPHDVMVGTVSVVMVEGTKRKDKFFEIGYVLDDTYWSNGYMTEAVAGVTEYLFKNNLVDKLMICHADYNIASRKVITHNHYQFYKRIKKTYLANPEIFYIFCYLMTKEEYEKNENKS